jgi:hypothetical protein
MCNHIGSKRNCGAEPSTTETMTFFECVLPAFSPAQLASTDSNNPRFKKQKPLAAHIRSNRKRVTNMSNMALKTFRVHLSENVCRLSSCLAHLCLIPRLGAEFQEKKNCFLRPSQGLWADGGSSRNRHSDDLLANYGRKYVFFYRELGPPPRTYARHVPRFGFFRGISTHQKLQSSHIEQKTPRSPRFVASISPLTLRRGPRG